LKPPDGSNAPLSVLIAPDGLSISAPTWVADVDQLSPFVTTGVALARALSQ
jgi:hypothetical protein